MATFSCPLLPGAWAKVSWQTHPARDDQCVERVSGHGPSAAHGRKPIGIGCVPGHLAVQVRRAVCPPDRAAFAQGLFGGIDGAVGGVLGVPVGRRPGRLHRAAGVHQRLRQPLPLRLGKARVRRPPEPPAHDDIAPVRGAGRHQSSSIS